MDSLPIPIYRQFGFYGFLLMVVFLAMVGLGYDTALWGMFVGLLLLSGILSTLGVRRDPGKQVLARFTLVVIFLTIMFVSFALRFGSGY